MESSDFLAENSSPVLNMASKPQVLPEDILTDISAVLLDETRCREWILNKLHPAGPKCPYCQASLAEKQAPRFWRDERVECPGCGKWFNALTGTIFYKVRFSFSELVLFMVLLGMNQPNKFVAERLNVDRETVRIWKNKFLEFRKKPTISE